MVSNVVIDRDPAGNIKPTKGKSNGKIDGVVAAIMAIGAAIRPTDEVRSVYDPEGETTKKSWYEQSI
jgi:phage terminase large subunit-like protein